MVNSSNKQRKPKGERHDELWSVSKLKAHLKQIKHKLRKVDAGYPMSKVLLVPMKHFLPVLNISKH